MHKLARLISQISIAVRGIALNRDAAGVLRRARKGIYKPSTHLTAHVTQYNDVPDYSRKPWFVILALVAAFAAGYVIADDKRIDAANLTSTRAK